MGLQLTRIDDPRDPLERARKPELLRFARENGLGHVITDAMPAILMRRELRKANLTRIKLPKRTLGMPDQMRRGTPALQPSIPSPLAETNGVEIDAEDDLARQLATAAAMEAASRPKTLAEMTYNELRKEAVRRRIPLRRDDTLAMIREKLGVKDPA